MSHHISSLPLSLSDKRQGVDQFVLLANASEKVPLLPKDCLYADFQLTKKDWDRLSIIHEVLRVHPYFFSFPSVLHHPLLLYQEPSNIQQTFSNEQTHIMWCIIPALEFLVKRWESMVEQPRFCDVKDAIWGLQLEEVVPESGQHLQHFFHLFHICLGALPHTYCLTQLTLLE